MDSQAVVRRILATDLSNPVNISYLFDMARNLDDVNLAKKARDAALRAVRKDGKAYDLAKEIYDWLATRDFDSYLIALEWNRKPEEKFYMPRRKQLRGAVDGLQALADDELDELFISMIPRAGKTSLLLFYVTWVMGRNSELANLYCAYSDTITNAFYNGILEVLNDPTTYRWHEIFPNSQIAATNSKEETINLDRKKRYASLTCRSLYGTLNGAVDANGVLISDDLLSGIEEALSKDRLITAWGKVDNNMLSRAKGGCKILWCGTRWSLADPIGLRIDTLTNNENFKKRRFKIINIPALNEKDESNFDYDYGVGFTTEYLRQRRASFERNNDLASWNAQYMGEPIEREGTVFSPYDFRYYNGVLPDGVPDRIFMAVDPAWGSGDYVASPIIAKFGSDLYVMDVVYDNNDKRITQKLIADKAIQYGVSAIQIEATKMTAAYAEGVEEILKERGKKLNITTKSANGYTVVGKQQRIFDKAPDIRERMIFLEDGKRSREYSLFMQNVFSFKMVGKNKNDDAPDSLCMAIDMDQTTTYKTRIMDRLF